MESIWLDKREVRPWAKFTFLFCLFCWWLGSWSQWCSSCWRRSHRTSHITMVCCHSYKICPVVVRAILQKRWQPGLATMLYQVQKQTRQDSVRLDIYWGIAQWLERRTRDWKVTGSNPCWNGGRIFFSRVDFLCWLLFRYPFHPRVTTVARKRSRSFCQKCRWQVTAKHAYTLRMWLLLNRASALVTTCP